MRIAESCYGVRTWLNIQDGETITMAPMVVHNKVFVGDSGG